MRKHIRDCNDFVVVFYHGARTVMESYKREQDATTRAEQLERLTACPASVIHKSYAELMEQEGILAWGSSVKY